MDNADNAQMKTLYSDRHGDSTAAARRLISLVPAEVQGLTADLGSAFTQL